MTFSDFLLSGGRARIVECPSPHCFCLSFFLSTLNRARQECVCITIIQLPCSHWDYVAMHQSLVTSRWLVVVPPDAWESVAFWACIISYRAIRVCSLPPLFVPILSTPGVLAGAQSIKWLMIALSFCTGGKDVKTQDSAIRSHSLVYLSLDPPGPPHVACYRLNSKLANQSPPKKWITRSHHKLKAVSVSIRTIQSPANVDCRLGAKIRTRKKRGCYLSYVYGLPVHRIGTLRPPNHDDN